MRKQPFFSIIIPTYNRAHCIEFAINSVLDQTINDFEIIVVDDGSTDGTELLLEQYGDQVRYFYQQNSGVSEARNLGIKNAHGQWVAFLDSDDEWMPEKLSIQYEAILLDNNIVISVTDCLIVEGDDSLSLFSIRGYTPEASPFQIITEPLCTIARLQFFTPSVIIDKDILVKAGLFDINMRLYEDLDLFLRVATFGALVVTPKKLVKVFNRGDVSLSSTQEHISFHGPAASVKTYYKLLNDYSLNHREEIFLKNRLSGNRFRLGFEQIKNKIFIEGFKNIIQSFNDDRGVKSFFRCVLFFITLGLGIILLNKIKSVKNGSYKRSNYSKGKGN